ncbi:hypothetical protein DFP72DRAFT_1066879 [Ephemerocybe angulata]|uniref:Uncharacterized protein n=1 Tax=Ephemerocybe angulata TaxID=980116 RepID=A0A8H6HZP5_9AGAR|nr:hypothetical protein DFP72DRAFT_1066879 [Tulosesus angulatus]
MAHPPASAPAGPSKKRKRTPTTSTIPKPTTTTLTPAHFARLSAIWALDRRIPSPASRAAWAAARGLNAAKVHEWWYRCRAWAKMMGVEIPEGSYEMDVGDPEAEEEEERKAREERAEKVKRRRVKIKKEVVEEVEMRKGEEEEMEEAKGKGDTPAIPRQTSPVPMSLPLAQVLIEVDEEMKNAGERDIREASAATQSPPLTLSQYFLPPSSPYATPSPRSAPFPPASSPAPPDLPRLTWAAKRLYIHALEPVPKASAVSSHSAPVQPLSERWTSLNDNIQHVSVPKTKVTVEPKPPASRAKKPAHRPVKTTIIPPKTSKPSRKRSKTTRPPAAAPRTASRYSPPPPPVQATTSRALVDVEIDDPLPTPANLERALYEGITFERCVDISLSAVPYLFGVDACGYQLGYGGSRSESLGSDESATSAAHANATAAIRDDVDDSATVDT